MKNIIRKIITEEVNQKKEKLERYILKTLKGENFDRSTPYNVIIKFINDNFSISGLEAFQIYQLFTDNINVSDYEDEELYRSNITKKKFNTANSKGRELVTNRIPFKGSNTQGIYVNSGKTYVVYSYNWYPIFVYKNGQWFENSNRYSVSTAKQMSQLRPITNVDIIKLSKSDLEDIIRL
jgi:hypothetical protein